MPLFINDCVIRAITTKTEKFSSTSVTVKYQELMEDLTGRNVSSSCYHLFKIAK
jgi:hypothetical protein